MELWVPTNPPLVGSLFLVKGYLLSFLKIVDFCLFV